ncbi:MAG: hypothetical protein QG670_1938 [Thermoproteota archaeon]|nr:hypothetical protein [Thermoproteota archaeon]
MLNERVMVFFDGSNLFKTCEGLSPPIRPDILKMRDLLVNGRKHIRTYYFCSVTNPPRENQVRFFDRLRSLHINVIDKQLKYRGDSPDGKPIYIEKGVDVALVTTMLSLAYANAFDVAIIVGGDNDYIQAVEEVKRFGKIVEIAFFLVAIGIDFMYCGDNYTSFDDKIDLIKLE